MSSPLARSITPAALGQQQALMGIGQVLARLKPEFPDLSPSKLRFLEEQRLVFPARTESGYRKFSARDIDRLRLILTMQRDHYLPLKIIRTQLAELDAGREPTMPTTTAGPSMLSGERRYTRDELLREAGGGSWLLDEAVSASLIAAGDTFSEDALGVLRALVELGEVGIEPRHLRGFRASAEREVALLETALMPIIKRRDSSSRARGAELALELAGQLDVVRASLIRRALERIGG